jgi:hypothetical protein
MHSARAAEKTLLPIIPTLLIHVFVIMLSIFWLHNCGLQPFCHNIQQILRNNSILKESLVKLSTELNENHIGDIQIVSYKRQTA